MTERKLPSHRKIVSKLVVVAIAMFAFGFVVMPPLYTMFCEVTGLGGRGIKVAESNDNVEAVDREVKVRFAATTHSSLPWQFQAQEDSMRVSLGEMSEALYLAMNPTDSAITGHAIYNVTPPEASLYFVKTECFCFTQQVLKANETREMPVYYFIQPDLPEYIKEITLSYTFYRDEKADAVALSNAKNSSTGN